MATKSASINRQLVYQETYEPILTDWVETTANFYVSYQRLAAYVHQNVSHEKLRVQKSIYIGQCPTVQVVTLLKMMGVELKRLLQDTYQSDTAQQLPITENYQQLVAHTRVLKRLNQQAQLRLLLITNKNQ